MVFGALVMSVLPSGPGTHRLRNSNAFRVIFIPFCKETKTGRDALGRFCERREATVAEGPGGGGSPRTPLRLSPPGRPAHAPSLQAPSPRPGPGNTAQPHPCFPRCPAPRRVLGGRGSSARRGPHSRPHLLPPDRPLPQAPRALAPPGSPQWGAAGSFGPTHPPTHLPSPASNGPTARHDPANSHGHQAPLSCPVSGEGSPPPPMECPVPSRTPTSGL